MWSRYLKSVQLNSCKALEELEICGCGQLGVLEGLQFLTSLRTLNIRMCQQLGALDSLQFLTSLQSLKIHECQQLGVLDGLQFLTSLQSLKIHEYQQLGAMDGLQFLTSLGSLDIEMNPELSAAWDRDPKLQGGNQIGLLPPSITELEISNLTNNVQSRLLSCLPATTKLVVQESPELTSLHLGHCPALTNLKIRHCESIASLHLGHCTALTELEITDCELLASIEGFQSLTNMTSFIVPASHSLLPRMELLLQQQGACEVLSRLTKLEIGDASVLTMSLCKQLTSLRCLKFRGKQTSPMVSLTEEQERALQLLTFLQKLEFWDFPNLLLLPADLRNLMSLEVLSIWSCPSISELPEMGTSCRLEVYSCSEELSQRCKEWQKRRMEMKNDE